MNIEGLEYTSRLQTLEAENKHLKSLLNKVASTQSDAENKLFGILNVKLEYLARKRLGFEELVIDVLKEFGKHIDVDRISLYAYNDKMSGYQAKYQWSQNDYQEYHPADLFINDDENPLLIPTHGNAFASSSLKEELKDSLAQKFETFQVQSVLIIPFQNQHIVNGFFVLESCLFNRFWYDFEVNEVSAIVKSIASFLNEQWFSRVIQTERDYNRLLDDVIEIAAKSEKATVAIQQIFELVGERLQLINCYVIKHDSIDNHHELHWSSSLYNKGNALTYKDVEKLRLKDGTEVLQYYKGDEIGLLNKCFGSENGLMLCRLHCHYDQNALLVVEFKPGVDLAAQRNVQFFRFLAQHISYMLNERKRKGAFGEISERYQKVIESSIDGVIIIDKNANIKFINKSACDLLGYDSDSHDTLNMRVMFSEKEKNSIIKVINQLSGGSDFRSDVLLQKKDGSETEVEMCATTIQLEGVDHFYFALHDIHSRKENEKLLTKSEKEFRDLAQNSPDIILRLNRDGKILFYNQTLLDQFGFLNPDEIVGKSLTGIGVLDEFVGTTWLAKINDVFSFGEKLSMELGFSDESRELYFDWIMTPEFNDHGEVQSLLAIGRSVTARKNVERELMEAKVKAEESDRLKSSFLANISHELRTPLNAIVGFSGLLRGNDISKEDKEEYVGVIHKNSDSLMSLINNIIDVAKIESGKISVEHERVNIHAMLDSLYADFASKIEIEHKGRVKLYLSKPNEDKRFISTDPIRLKQIFVNLIENAIKFTIKGFVEFGYAVEDGKLRFYVKDTGIGISDAKQKVIFEPFRKEADNSQQLFSGTGIGLSICEKIVSALGGQIGLVSQKGQGSEFYFIHPCLKEVQEDNCSSVIYKNLSVSGLVLPKNYYWPNKLMLLVDQNSSSHLQMRKIIEKTGLTLVSARTAAGASKLLMNRSDIDLVLMDLNFPDSDGFELLKLIKSRSGVPVVAHSDKVMHGERDKLLEMGFNACVSKPTEKDELLKVMDLFLVEADS
jgi:PAS domain S-box-containing protein